MQDGAVPRGSFLGMRDGVAVPGGSFVGVQDGAVPGSSFVGGQDGVAEELRPDIRHPVQSSAHQLLSVEE